MTLDDIDWKGSRQIVADSRPNEPQRLVIALADGRVVAVEKAEPPRLLFGPLSQAEAEALAHQVVAGDARSITEPLALGFLATAFLGFVVSGAGPSGSAAPSRTALDDGAAQ